MGYDYLALKAMVNRGVISGIGSKIGVGKVALRPDFNLCPLD